MKVHLMLGMESVTKHEGKRDGGAWPKLIEDTIHFYESIGAEVITTYKMLSDPDPLRMRERAETLLAGVQRNDLIIMPVPYFPLYFHNREFYDILLEVAHCLCHAKVVGLILDLFSYRLTEDVLERPLAQEYIERERTFLGQVDGIIAQSEPMAQAILDNSNFHGKLVSQGPWGFRTQYHAAIQNRSDTVVYGGNLKKATYLNELPSDFGVKFNVYGPHAKFNGAEQDQTFNFKGSYDFAVVERMIAGGFGLVWDSEHFGPVSGGPGMYMQMAMPHKFSMYTVAGIPSIVWDKACIAPILKDHKIGWTLESLDQLPDLIASISDDEYQERVRNLSDFSDFIRDGYFQKRAIFKMIGALYNGDEEPIASDFKMKIGWI